MKTGTVAIIGYPSAGKSSLINAVLKTHALMCINTVAMTDCKYSDKSTHSIMCIYNDSNMQGILNLYAFIVAITSYPDTGKKICPKTLEVLKVYAFITAIMCGSNAGKSTYTPLKYDAIIIAIIGRPNADKSSLINAMLKTHAVMCINTLLKYEAIIVAITSKSTNTVMYMKTQKVLNALITTIMCSSNSGKSTHAVILEVLKHDSIFDIIINLS